MVLDLPFPTLSFPGQISRDAITTTIGNLEKKGAPPNLEGDCSFRAFLSNNLRSYFLLEYLQWLSFSLPGWSFVKIHVPLRAPGGAKKCNKSLLPFHYAISTTL